MIPEKLPEEDHGLGLIRLLTNCVLLGTALPVLLLAERPFGAEVIVAGLLMTAYAVGLRVVQRRIFAFAAYFLALAGLLLGLLALVVFFIPGANGSRPDISALLFTIVIGLAATLTAVNSRIVGTRRIYPVIPLVIYPVCIYCMSFIFERVELRLLSFFVEAALLILCLLFYNRRSLVRSFFEAQGYNNVPYEKIRRSNGQKMLGMSFLAIVVLAIIAFFDHGAEVLAGMRDFIARVMQWVLSLIPELPAEELAPDSSAPASTCNIAELIEELHLEEPKNNPALEAFWNVVFALLAVIGIIIFSMLVWSFFKNFLREFRLARKENNDVVVYVPPAETEEREREAPKSPGFFDRTPEAKIRRLYLRFIQKQPGAKRIHASETPSELEMTAGVRDSDFSANASVQEVHEIYERARYSTLGVTNEDVRRMRGAVKALEK